MQTKDAIKPLATVGNAVADSFEMWLAQWRNMLSVPLDDKESLSGLEARFTFRDGDLHFVPLSGDPEASRKGIEAQKCELLRPSELALELSTLLPREADKHLDDILRMEVERLTPFSLTDVVFDYQVVDGTNQDAPLDVVIYVVRRSSVDPLIERCMDEGYSVERINIYSGGDTIPHIDLLNPGRAVDEVGKGYIVAAAATFLTFISVWALLLLFQAGLTSELSELQAEAADLRPAALLSLEMVAEKERLIAQIRQYSGNSVHTSKTLVLDEVARLLPDGTWVKALRINAESADINGISDDASSVAELLADADIFSQVSFTSAIKTLPDGTEEFALRAKLRGADEG